MDFQVGDEQPLPGIGEHVTVMTQVCIKQKEVYKLDIIKFISDGIISTRYT